MVLGLVHTSHIGLQDTANHEHNRSTKIQSIAGARIAKKALIDSGKKQGSRVLCNSATGGVKEGLPALLVGAKARRRRTRVGDKRKSPEMIFMINIDKQYKRASKGRKCSCYSAMLLLCCHPWLQARAPAAVRHE